MYVVKYNVFVNNVKFDFKCKIMKYYTNLLLSKIDNWCRFSVKSSVSCTLNVVYNTVLDNIDQLSINDLYVKKKKINHNDNFRN